MMKKVILIAILCGILYAQTIKMIQSSKSGQEAFCGVPGYQVVDCACGSKCGSWDFSGTVDKCHCQCGEWTKAVCAKLEDEYGQTIPFTVKSIDARGSKASCEAGQIPVSCSCGNWCANWIIEGNTCNCNCANQDWSMAQCIIPRKKDQFNFACERMYLNAQAVTCPANQYALACQCDNSCNSWDLNNDGNDFNQCKCQPGCGSKAVSGTCCSVKRIKYCAIVYSECDYKGQNMDFCDDTTDFTFQVKSVRVPKGMEVAIFEQKSYRGKKIVLTKDTPCIKDTDFNFMSMKITKLSLTKDSHLTSNN